jgi:hypothetical protein
LVTRYFEEKGYKMIELSGWENKEGELSILVVRLKWYLFS